jgi:DNA-binding response OmpR family regulator
VRKKLLVVDDEPKLLQAVAAFFESRGYDALPAENGRRALEIFDSEEVSLVILDLMMPGMSGEDVCRALRRRSRVPIIILTAKAGEDDVVETLALGADDYVIKPFSLKTLAARAEAVMRRAEDTARAARLTDVRSAGVLQSGALTIDFEKNAVTKRGRLINLTMSELKILFALARSPGRAYTRDELIELALGDEFDGYDRAVDNHIKNLRRKIEDDTRSPVYILTAHGLGYRFGGETEPTAAADLL